MGQHLACYAHSLPHQGWLPLQHFWSRGGPHSPYPSSRCNQLQLYLYVECYAKSIFVFASSLLGESRTKAACRQAFLASHDYACSIGASCGERAGPHLRGRRRRDRGIGSYLLHRSYSYVYAYGRSKFSWCPSKWPHISHSSALTQVRWEADEFYLDLARTSCRNAWGALLMTRRVASSWQSRWWTGS